jgi:hypothetical protein
VSGYAIETPRLLLNSADQLYPDGLANSSGLVGKNLMVQANQAVYGTMEQEVRWYKGPLSLALTGARGLWAPWFWHDRSRLGFRMPARREQSTRAKVDSRRPKASEKRTRGKSAISWPSMGKWSGSGVGGGWFCASW